jgi:hypothetical protein
MKPNFFRIRHNPVKDCWVQRNREQPEEQRKTHFLFSSGFCLFLCTFRSSSLEIQHQTKAAVRVVRTAALGWTGIDPPERQLSSPSASRASWFSVMKRMFSFSTPLGMSLSACSPPICTIAKPNVACIMEKRKVT